MPTFSLRNLFVFVFACCVYLAALRGVAAIWFDEGFHVCSLVTACLIGSWVLLGLVYASWRLRSALLVHFFGLIAVGVIVPIVLAVDGLPADTSLAEMGVRALTAGCAVSTFFSFPTTILVILVIARNKKRQKASEPPATHP